MILKEKMDKKSCNQKCVHRIYCELRLNIRVKSRNRIPKGEAKVLVQPILSNVCWSMGYMSDALNDGWRFRTFNVIDDYNREALLVDPDFSLPGSKVIQLLDGIAITRGCPEVIRVDNGIEFTPMVFKEWAA